MIMRSRGWIGLGLVVALAGCEGQNPFAFLDRPPDTAVASTAPPATGETRDVEAPEIFGVTDAGLWDGRPSLGGVWVAFPDVPEPERVIIRNTVNGSSVVGALFRRERENPGPRFQISSDAAEALNILAGAPTELEVVALTREAVAAPEPATEAPEASVDPTAIAAAAIEAAELADTGAAPPAPIPAPAPAPASALSRPYIQIGIFNIEANASATATQMRAAGLSAETITQESQGNTFYRVIVGPAQTETARDAALDTVRGLGFSDAYFVTN
jgi:cell division septation protein DedD